MFEQSVVNASRTRAPQAVLLSALIQSAVVSFVVILPLLHVAGIGVPRSTAPPVAVSLQPAPLRARVPPVTTVFHSLLAVPLEPARLAPPALLHEQAIAPQSAPATYGAAPTDLENLPALPTASAVTPGPPPPPLAAANSASIRVGGEIQAARCLYCPAPAYPSIAQQLHLEGEVRLRAHIGVNGDVVSLTPEQGNPILAAAARRAILSWRYRPLLLNGAPIAVDTEITVRFTLDR